MRAERGLKNPVVAGIIIHGCVFVALLVAVIIGARAADPGTTVLMAVVIVPLTVAVIVSAGVTSAVLKRKERYRRVVQLNPGASIVRAEWNSGVLAPFLNDGPALKGTNYRGFGVEICADAKGVSFWRSRTRREVASLGIIPWERVLNIQPNTVRAVIGSKVAETIRIDIEAVTSTPYKAHMELIVRDVPAREGADLLMSRRPIPCKHWGE